VKALIIDLIRLKYPSIHLPNLKNGLSS